MVQTNILEEVVGETFSEYLSVVTNFTLGEFLASSMDPFRFGFNVELFGLREAIRKELEHKIEMKLEDLFGNYHEKYLGKARHIPSNSPWRILKRGEMPGIDIANDEQKRYLQIKNKHNSLNSSSAKRLATELQRVSEEKPNAIVGAGWVIAGPSRSCIGENYIEPVARIFKGNDLYSFVTGNKNEMKEALDAFRSLVDQQSQRYDFPCLISDAVDRVAQGLESRAKFNGLSVVDFLYRHATR